MYTLEHIIHQIAYRQSVLSPHTSRLESIGGGSYRKVGGRKLIGGLAENTRYPQKPEKVGGRCPPCPIGSAASGNRKWKK